MTEVELMEIIFSHAEMAEFGQKRMRQALAAGERASIPITIPDNKIMFVYRYRFGDIPVNIFNFAFNARNSDGSSILLGTEHLNFDTKPFPLLICKGDGSGVTVVNNDVISRDFEMTYDYFIINEQLIPVLEEMLGWKFKV